MTKNEYKYLTSICCDKKYQPLFIDTSEDHLCGRYTLGLKSIFVPSTSPF